MQLFSYNLHPLLLSCFMICFIAFPNMFFALSCFLVCSIVSYHVSLLFAMLYCFDDVGLAFLGQDMPKFGVCAQIYVPRRVLACSCLDLLVYVLHTMFVLRSISSGAPCHVFSQIYIFVCSLPCSCVQIYMLVVMPCASKSFLSLIISFFLCFGPFGRVQIQILWFRPTSMHLALYQRVWIISFMCINVCLLASMLYPCLPVQIQALPCFVPSVDLCLLVFETTCLCGCICPSCGLSGCYHL